MCEGVRGAFLAGSPGWQRAAPARLSPQQGRRNPVASVASAAKARGFSCPETKYVGATSTSIVLKSEGFCAPGHPLFKRAATSPTSSLDARDTGVFMQIHAAKMFASLLCCSFPLFTTFSQLGD